MCVDALIEVVGAIQHDDLSIISNILLQIRRESKNDKRPTFNECATGMKKMFERNRSEVVRFGRFSFMASQDGFHTKPSPKGRRNASYPVAVIDLVEMKAFNAHVDENYINTFCLKFFNANN